MAETHEDRHNRLVRQAEKMRAKQAEKKQAKERHVCPPDVLGRAFDKLEKAMARYAPGNTAPIPVAFSLETAGCLPDGSDAHMTWFVLIHVRIPRVTEYEVEADGATLTDAILAACKTLGAQSNLLRGARADATTFSLTF
jgi:hypothetical protein